MVEVYVHMYEERMMKPVETVLRKREGRIKEKDGGGESNYDIL
jgi:hypothetical protein